MSGNPSLPASRSHADRRKPSASLESVFQTLQGTRWAYLVLARPVSQAEIRQALAGLAFDERELVSAYLRHGTAEENNNPHAKYYLELLQAAHKQHEIGIRQGMWNVHAVLLADQQDRLLLGSQTLLGAFAGPDSKPQPIRIRPCLPPGRAAGHALPDTSLTTWEAAALARLPAEEFAGYALRDFVQLAVSPPVVPPAASISLGPIVDRGRRSENWFELGIGELCKHVLVAGVPGSGKTQSCQFLLRQLWEEHGVPWLVLEPP